MTVNGVQISEFNLLASCIIYSVLLLLTLAVGVVAAILLHDKAGRRAKKRMRALAARAESDPIARARLDKLRRKAGRGRKDRIVSNITIWGLLAVLIAVNLCFATIPCWADYATKDYVVYTGNFTAHDYARQDYIILEDGTWLQGRGGYNDGDWFGKVVYSRRSRIVLNDRD